MDDHIIQNTSVRYHTTPAYARLDPQPNNAHHTQTRGELPGEIHLGHKEVDVDPVRISIWRDDQPGSYGYNQQQVVLG